MGRGRAHLGRAAVTDIRRVHPGRGVLNEHPLSEPPSSGWRLITSADIPFIYRLVAAVDPRWWRFSRDGLEPSHLLETASGVAAGVIVFDEGQQPVACAVLADAGASGTGMLELFSLPDPAAQALARRYAPDLLVAAFDGAPIRRLYVERFSGDPDLLGPVADLFEVEVCYPDFAMIDGRYEDRTTAVLTAERFAEWRAQHWPADHEVEG